MTHAAPAELPLVHPAVAAEVPAVHAVAAEVPAVQYELGFEPAVQSAPLAILALKSINSGGSYFISPPL